jgi:hypothetical protein
VGLSPAASSGKEREREREREREKETRKTSSICTVRSSSGCFYLRAFIRSESRAFPCVRRS